MAYRWDSFISYCEEDEKWVQTTLLPRLKKEDITFCTPKDFRGGSQRLDEIRRLVNQSLRTIVVLSPTYLHSKWNELDRIITQSKDPAAKHRRLIPLRLKECKTPANMAHLVEPYDFTGKSKWKNELGRLIEHIQQASPQITGNSLKRTRTSRRDRPPTPDQSADPQQIPTDFVIVTPLQEERDALLDKLPGHEKLRPIPSDIRTYFRAHVPITCPEGNGSYKLIIFSLLEKGRVGAALGAADGIRQWHPRYIVLVGIAGGIAAKEIGIGDILIADYVVDYEVQKVYPQKTEPRWVQFPTDAQLLNACKNFTSPNWHQRMNTLRPDSANPKLHFGTIASSDKVIASAEELKLYERELPKLIGVEMEAAGVAQAALQSTDKPSFFMIRSVSDLADEKKDSAMVARWRPYVCEAAALFTVELLKSQPVFSAGIRKSASAQEIAIHPSRAISNTRAAGLSEPRSDDALTNAGVVAVKRSPKFRMLYARNARDRDLAVHLARSLRLMGLDESPSIDIFDRPITTQVKRLMRCDYLIVVISLKALALPWIRNEINNAARFRKKRKPVILFALAEDCVAAIPASWRQFVTFNFYKSAFGVAVTQLVREGMGIDRKALEITKTFEARSGISDEDRWLTAVAPGHVAHPFRLGDLGDLFENRFADDAVRQFLDAVIRKYLKRSSLAEITESAFASQIENKLVAEADGSIKRLLGLGTSLFSVTSQRWATGKPKKTEKLIKEKDWKKATAIVGSISSSSSEFL